MNPASYSQRAKAEADFAAACVADCAVALANAEPRNRAALVSAKSRASVAKAAADKATRLAFAAENASMDAGELWTIADDAGRRNAAKLRIASDAATEDMRQAKAAAAQARACAVICGDILARVQGIVGL